jgi:hypothetical protein
MKPKELICIFIIIVIIYFYYIYFVEKNVKKESFISRIIRPHYRTASAFISGNYNSLYNGGNRFLRKIGF